MLIFCKIGHFLRNLLTKSMKGSNELKFNRKKLQEISFLAADDIRFHSGQRKHQI